MGCALAAPAVVATSMRAGAVDQVSVGMVNTISDAGFFVAEAKGYFRAAGIEVKFLPFASATTMIPVLASGEPAQASPSAFRATLLRRFYCPNVAAIPVMMVVRAGGRGDFLRLRARGRVP